MLEQYQASVEQFVYFRKPPAKRPNYARLGALHPFQPAWDCLLGLRGSDCSDTGLPVRAASASNKQEPVDHTGDASLPTPARQEDIVLEATVPASVPSRPSAVKQRRARSAGAGGAGGGAGAAVEVTPHAPAGALTAATPASASAVSLSVSAVEAGAALMDMPPYLSQKAAKSGRPRVAPQAPNQPEFLVVRSLNSLRGLLPSASSVAGGVDEAWNVLDAVRALGYPGLVRVTVYMHKGVPDKHAMICLPLALDRLEYSRQGDQWHGPEEAPHRSPQSHERHNQQLAGLPSTNGVLVAGAGDAAGSTHDSTAPSPCVLTSCARQCVGYVTYGAQSLIRGLGYGEGFVSMEFARALFGSTAGAAAKLTGSVVPARTVTAVPAMRQISTSADAQGAAVAAVGDSSIDGKTNAAAARTGKRRLQRKDHVDTPHDELQVSGAVKPDDVPHRDKWRRGGPSSTDMPAADSDYSDPGFALLRNCNGPLYRPCSLRALM